MEFIIAVKWNKLQFIEVSSKWKGVPFNLNYFFNNAECSVKYLKNTISNDKKFKKNII